MIGSTKQENLDELDFLDLASGLLSDRCGVHGHAPVQTVHAYAGGDDGLSEACAALEADFDRLTTLAIVAGVGGLAALIAGGPWGAVIAAAAAVGILWVALEMNDNIDQREEMGCYHL